MSLEQSRAASLGPRAGLIIARLVPFVVPLLLLGPALKPGYTLLNDMVAVPHQTLQPWNVGVGSGLPRAVPQDFITAVVSGPVPGWVLQKACLYLALVAAGTGVARWVDSRALGALAAVLAVWNPFVVERLAQGHWALLMGYAAIPWVLLILSRMHRGRDLLLLAGVVWLGSWVPTSGVLMCLVVLTCVSFLRPPRGLALGAVAIAVVMQTPWVLAALMGGASTAGAAGADVFALRSEGPWGWPVTAVGGGGLWNEAAVPGSRSWPFGAALGLAVLAFAIVGYSRAVRAHGRVITSWVGLSVLCFVLAVAGRVPGLGSAQEWVVRSVPGGGLLRDGHKWLAPVVLCLAVLAAYGFGRAREAMPAEWSGVALALALVAPVVVMPDAALGLGGRLGSVDYPDGWDEVRSVVARDPADVVSLPWSTFRSYDWNDRRTVLDPAPRFFTTTVVSDDSLLVLKDDSLVRIPGESPRASALSEMFARDSTPDEILRALQDQSIGWVLVQRGQPVEPDETSLSLTRVVWSSPELELRRVDGVGPAGWNAPARLLAAWSALLSVAALVCLAFGVLACVRDRKSSS